MTEKLYDIDSHMSVFDAVVLSCEKDGENWRVVLDKTAFFPEGGGQPADTGYIDEVRVSDVQIKDGVIYHTTDGALDSGIQVAGRLDWEQRFRRMQGHSGEHIVSGHIHNEFGFNNVGFHMGSEDITVDIDGVLTEQDIRRIETLANRTVAANVPITARYPEPQELAEMNYRSKLDLTENVRIVTIEGCDVCACCAPHVSRTGEIGLIKLLDFMSWKGGVRIHMLCGFDALEDYENRCKNVRSISGMLSVKQVEVADAVARVQTELAAQRQETVRLRRRYVDMLAQSVESTDGDVLIIESGLDRDDLKRLADAAADKCGGICAVFSGSEGDYIYNMASRHVDLRVLSKEINSLLCGKGGGSPEMITGKAACSAEELSSLFARLGR